MRFFYIMEQPDLGPRRIMQLFGLKKAFDVMGAGELRTIFAKFSSRGWDRLTIPSPFRVLWKPLAKFEPLKV